MINNKICRLIMIVFSFFFVLIFFSCSDEPKPIKEIKFDDSEVKLKIGEPFNIKTKFDGYVPSDITYIVEDEYFTLNSSYVIPLKEGSTTIKCKSLAEEFEDSFDVLIYEYNVKFNIPTTIKVGEIIDINYDLVKDTSDEISFISSDESIIKIIDNKIEALKAGKASIIASSNGTAGMIDITVQALEPTKIIVNPVNNLHEESRFEISYQVEPLKASQEVTFEFDNEFLKFVNTNEKSYFTCSKEGKTNIKIISKEKSDVYTTIEINIGPSESPKFIKEEGFKKMLEVNFNDASGLLQGLKITDNKDKNLESKVSFDKNALLSYGEKKIVLSVKDSDGNTTNFERDIKVVYKYHTKFVGHAGCTFGVPNSEEAFLYAAEVLKYTAMECDVQVTKDGIYVTNHDSFITDEKGNKMVISEHTYNELKDIPIKYYNYTSHLCLLDRYLEICKENSIEAIIEIKGSSPGLSDYSQSNVPKLLEYLKTKGMYNQSIILCGIEKVCTAVRTFGYDDIRVMYLVDSCDSQAVLDLCKKYKLDLSTNVTYGGSNSDEWLAKYKAAGCKINVWTFSSTSTSGYNQVQTWIDKGVDYVTCDCHDMTKLNLK